MSPKVLKLALTAGPWLACALVVALWWHGRTSAAVDRALLDAKLHAADSTIAARDTAIRSALTRFRVDTVMDTRTSAQWQRTADSLSDELADLSLAHTLAVARWDADTSAAKGPPPSDSGVPIGDVRRLITAGAARDSACKLTVLDCGKAVTLLTQQVRDLTDVDRVLRAAVRATRLDRLKGRIEGAVVMGGACYLAGHR